MLGLLLGILSSSSSLLKKGPQESKEQATPRCRSVRWRGDRYTFLGFHVTPDAPLRPVQIAREEPGIFCCLEVRWGNRELWLRHMSPGWLRKSRQTIVVLVLTEMPLVVWPFRHNVHGERRAPLLRASDSAVLLAGIALR